jgi:uncharacterized protein YidB (DUF937 family)
MGLMDSIKSLLGGGGKATGGATDDLMGAVTNFFSGQGAIGSKLGGLSGILDKFNVAGMGDKVKSWMGQGDNEPLTGDEVEKALGADTIHEIAKESGGTDAEVKSGLAGMIPGLVDKLTPDGGLPGMDQIGGMLKNIDIGKFLGGFGK